MEWSVILPALVAVGSAVFSAVMAGRARKADADAVRLRELESRLSDKKREIYEPLLQAMGMILTPAAVRPKDIDVDKDLLDSSLAFMRLGPAYASDEVILAFTRFRMGTATGPPPVIALRLTDDFFQAVRRDLTGGETHLGDMQLVGVRLNDLYTNDLYSGALDKSLEELAAEHQWTPPWQGHGQRVGLPSAK